MAVRRGVPVDNHLRWFVETLNRILSIYQTVLMTCLYYHILEYFARKIFKLSFCCVNGLSKDYKPLVEILRHEV